MDCCAGIHKPHLHRELGVKTGAYLEEGLLYVGINGVKACSTPPVYQGSLSWIHVCTNMETHIRFPWS